MPSIRFVNEGATIAHRTVMPVRRLASMGLAFLMLVTCLGIACQSESRAGAPAEGSDPLKIPATATTEPEGAGPTGVFDDEIIFGQSAAFTGAARFLGTGMRLGIEAAFLEVNQSGGVHGRHLVLESLDDAYEPNYSSANTKLLIENRKVFALIGAVGTPTARTAAPLAHEAGVPFIAPFTGAEFLRDPELDSVLNLRASYYQETEEMVERLTEDLGVTRVGVLYQNDSYGQNGLDGTTLALERRGLKPVVSGHYERNTRAVKSAVDRILEADPEAIIMVSSYAPAARTVELARREADPVLMAVSFVGSRALANALGAEGEGVYVTQVVPHPDDGGNPVIARYHAALADYDARAEPGFVSLEGYLAGRLAIAGLEACGRELSRNCFIKALHTAEPVDIDGMQLEFGPRDNQGSDEVFLTVMGADGEYRQVERLADPQ
ncbi:MAG: ABC transporter substrate-binding protein [Chloroflexota bacterium]|nr:ABC transporter substrate-binding protein [Chloroflexota bacterium]MDE2961853.1 ABC transporter substrate-binding protein [Chloroflexota bacterium]